MMISEFQQLSQKVEQIVALVQTLRTENTDLRRQISELANTNKDLTERIGQAHERVSLVLNQSPFTNESIEGAQ